MMARAVVTLILIVAFDVTVGIYVFITQLKTWSEAQTYCRTKYKDLAYVENENDFGLLLKSSGKNPPNGWIGLYRDPYNSSIWRWSGAGLMTYSFWASGEPSNAEGIENRVQVQDDNTWNDRPEGALLPFYCIQDLVVKTQLTWEKALEYCHIHGKNLAGPMLDHLTDKVMNEMQEEGVHDLVWTGLRFLGDQWLWVRGAPLDPQTQHEVRQCPVQDRCGVLNDQGLLQSWDCQDQLYFICE